ARAGREAIGDDALLGLRQQDRGRKDDRARGRQLLELRGMRDDLVGKAALDEEVAPPVHPRLEVVVVGLQELARRGGNIDREGHRPGGLRDGWNRREHRRGGCEEEKGAPDHSKASVYW